MAEQVEHFDKLVPLATVVANVSLVRELLGAIPAEWLHGRLWEAIEGELVRVGYDTITGHAAATGASSATVLPPGSLP